jgi:hypothetical protein
LSDVSNDDDDDQEEEKEKGGKRHTDPAELQSVEHPRVIAAPVIPLVTCPVWLKI